MPIDAKDHEHLDRNRCCKEAGEQAEKDADAPQSFDQKGGPVPDTAGLETHIGKDGGHPGRTGLNFSPDVNEQIPGDSHPDDEPGQGNSPIVEGLEGRQQQSRFSSYIFHGDVPFPMRLVAQEPLFYLATFCPSCAILSTSRA